MLKRGSSIYGVTNYQGEISSHQPISSRDKNNIIQAGLYKGMGYDDIENLRSNRTTLNTVSLSAIISERKENANINI